MAKASSRSPGADDADCVVIGEPQSGKTALIATALTRAIEGVHSFEHLDPHFSGGTIFRMVPRHDLSSGSNALTKPGLQAGDVDELRAQTIKALSSHTHWNATETNAFSYQFKLSYIKNNRAGFQSPFNSRNRRTERDFVVLDSGGGFIFPSHMDLQAFAHYSEAEKQALLAFETAVVSARSIMMCIPMTSGAQDANTIQRRSDLLNELWDRRRGEQPTSRLERLAVCLTKCEVPAAPHGRDAVHVAQSREFLLDAVASTIDRATLNALLRLANGPGKSGKTVQVCIFPVSTFGFVRHNGCANYDAHPDGKGGLLTIAQPTEGVEIKPGETRAFPLYRVDKALHYWRPFHIVDPLMFLSTGEKGFLAIDMAEDRETFESAAALG